nr:O-unit flippase-like protein [Polynucleobacter yangtzensis]
MKKNKNTYLAHFSQALNIGAGVILLPLVLRFFDPEQIKLWFVFITLGGLAQLFEFGFHPTLVRNIAYIFSGAQNLDKVGLPDFDSTKTNRLLLIALANSAKIVYRTIALFTLLAMLIAGSIYINSLITNHDALYPVLVSWTLFSVGVAVNFYYGYANGIIFGRGDLNSYYYSIVISKALFIILTALLIYLDFGLLSLGLSSLFSSIAGRFFSISRLGFKLQTSQTEEMKNLCHKLIKVLTHNAMKLGVVQLAGFFVVRGSILIASSYLSVDQSASYSLTLTLFIVLSTISTTYFQMEIPKIINFSAEGSKEKMVSALGKSVLISYLLFFFGFCVIAIFGQRLIEAAGGNVTVLDTSYIIAIGIIMLLEMNHGIFAYMLTTFNQVPFFYSSILTGVAVPLLSIFLVHRFGLWGIIFSQCFVQILYNNWKWPHEALNKIGVGYCNLLNVGYCALIKR